MNGAEGKRLELARALAADPVVILLDEIFTGLNADESSELAATVSALPGQGRTVLMIEHNIGAIRSVAQRVLALSAGEVVSEGSPDAVLADPKVVTSYLGQRASFPSADGLRVDGLKVRRGRVEVVRDVSLSVTPGAAWACSA